MLGRTLLTLGMAALLAIPAHAGLGLLLPDRPVVDDPEKNSVDIVVGAVEPSTGQGIPIERPQAFTALHSTGEETERSDHLSVLGEINAFGARAWRTSITLPRPGAYHFMVQSKCGWVPEQDKFIQYFATVQIPAYGSSEGWDKPAGLSFEIVPLSRPFGLCTGMAFTGQAIFDGKPLPGVVIDAARLDPALSPDIREPEDPNAPPAEQPPAKEKARKPEKQPTPRPISAFGDVQQVKTDSQGIFTFVCPLPGWWAFTASMAGDSLQDPEGKQKPLEIKTIFWVYLNDCAPAKPGKKQGA